MEGLFFYLFQIPGNKGFLNFMLDPNLAHILVPFNKGFKKGFKN